MTAKDAMTPAPRQLIFDMPHRDALGEEDFLVSQSNAQAVALIDRWPDWPVRAAVIAGPPGSGKSHLAHVWQAKSRARMIKAREITAPAVPELAEAGRLAVEDLDKGPVEEQALFHLLNLVREQKIFILLTSAVLPGDLVLRLPDFSSRLKALPLAQIEAPDDALLSAVLVKLFADRQLAVEPPVIAYCLVRMERSLDAARHLVAEIDTLALTMQRAVTRALAGKALDNLGASGEPG